MKKLTTLCLFLTAIVTSNAQKETLEFRKLEVRNEISDILSSAAEVYTPSGSSNKVTAFVWDANNDSYLTYYQYSSPIKSGSSESGKIVGYSKIRIDFSKLKYVASATTNFGHKCISFSTFFGGVGENAIGMQYTNPDQYGNHYQNSYSNTEMKGQCTMAIDSKELVDYFNDYMKLISEDKLSNPEKYENYQKKIAEKAKQKQEYEEAKRKEKVKEGFVTGGIIAGSALFVLILAHFGLFD